MSLQDSMKIFVYDVEERAMRLPEANSKEAQWSMVHQTGVPRATKACPWSFLLPQLGLFCCHVCIFGLALGLQHKVRINGALRSACTSGSSPVPAALMTPRRLWIISQYDL